MARKKKRGRPKKKKEQPIKIKKERTRKYKIVLTSCNKEIALLKCLPTQLDADKYFLELQKECEKVRFPIKHLNYGKIKEAKYEIFLLYPCENNEIENTSLLRNDYGTFVEYTTNSNKWIILDKAEYKKEESFWVFGYHPKYQRKTFQWIFEECIKNKLINKYIFANILVYQNKLIIDHGEDMDIVFCKCVNDANRLYNELQIECITNKIKQAIFGGNIRAFSRSSVSSWLDRLCEYTHFSRHKIMRNSLKP